MRTRRLAHGWELTGLPGLSPHLVAEFIRPALRAVPGSLAARLGPCRLSLPARLRNPDLSSRWTQTGERLEIEVATEGTEEHDVAMELLLCLGQALWETAGPGNRTAYLKLLLEEIEAEVSGEIDEQALEEKRLVLASRLSARSPRRFQRYARASFAGTLAEYLHCLWHDVTIRTGPDHLPALWLRRRLETLARWFPPDRGYRLFAGKTQTTGR
jgi:hypothetical protein